MPNWCYNSIQVTKGDNQKEWNSFTKLLEKNQNKGLLDTIIPTPFLLRHNVLHGFGNDAKQSLNFKLFKKNIRVFIPQFFINMWIKKYHAINWYDWNIIHWGSKWSESGFDSYFGNDTANLTFDTAWSPTLDGYLEISKHFPSLFFKLQYDEPMMCFKGMATFQNGELLSDDYQEYSYEDDEEREDN